MKLNRQETTLDDLHGSVGLVMGHVMQTKQEAVATKGMVEVVALRVARLDADKEISYDHLSRLRKDVRKLQEHKREAPPGNELTTGQQRALDENEAKRLIDEAATKRDHEREIKELREQNATQAKQIADIAAEQRDSSKFWKRNAALLLAGLLTSITTGYTVYRLTKPAVSQTIEYKETPKL